MCVSCCILFPVEFVVDCRKFLDSNALGLTVTALSSYDPQMRAVAYHVLAAYYSHLEGARFHEQSQVSRKSVHPTVGVGCGLQRAGCPPSLVEGFTKEHGGGVLPGGLC